MPTQDEIKTMALKELGREDVPDFLDSLENDVQNMNLQYDNLYAYCLSRFNWSFAKEWASLSNPTSVTGKFMYKFDLPTDFIYLRAVYEDDKYTQSTSDYEIVKNKIYTNTSNVYIEYTTRLNEEDLPAFFVEWFKFRLALALCTNATGDGDLISYLSKKEAFEYVNAVNADTRQKGAKVLDSSYFIRGR